MVPINNKYEYYENTHNITFFGGFRLYSLASALEKETPPPPGHYGVLISTDANDPGRNFITGLQSPSLDFIQGLVSAIDTFNLHYVLRYMIYRDGTYYNISGRNLVMPIE
jgi:hypothetical protein